MENNNTIKNNQVDCIIEFHTATNMITAQNEIDATKNLSQTHKGWHTGFNNSLLSCTTTKNMASPFGIFSIGLAHVRDSDGKSWLDVISPLDMVVIRFASSATLEEGEDYKLIPVMVGFVESIRKSSNYSESPTQTITIDGSDFGKLFFDYKLYYRYLWDLEGFAGKAIGRGITPYGHTWDVLGRIFHYEFIERSSLKFTYRANPSSDRLRNSRLAVGIENSLLGGTNKYEQQKDLDRIISGEFSMKEMIGFSLNASDGFNAGLDGLEIPENPIWTALAYYANLDFHELFFDLIEESKVASSTGKNAYTIIKNDKVHKLCNFRNPLLAIDDKYILTLIHRPKPYISRYGDTTRGIFGDELINLHKNLPKTVIQDNWIIQEDISVSSYEVFNHFGTQTSFLQAISGGNSNGGNDLINLAILSEIINRSSLNMYGQRKLLAETCLYPVERKEALDKATNKKVSHKDAMTEDVATNGGLMAYLAKLNTLLHDWYVYNDEFRSGNFVLVGNPNIKIGTVLIQNETVGGVEKEWNYYVQQVSHEFVRYSHYTTSVEVIRGFDANESLVIPLVAEKPKTNKEATLSVKDQYASFNGLFKKHSKDGFDALKLETQQSFLNEGVSSVNSSIIRDSNKQQVPFSKSSSSSHMVG